MMINDARRSTDMTVISDTERVDQIIESRLRQTPHVQQHTLSTTWTIVGRARHTR
jgi:hypothetical protein